MRFYVIRNTFDSFSLAEKEEWAYRHIWHKLNESFEFQNRTRNKSVQGTSFTYTHKAIWFFCNKPAILFWDRKIQY